MSRLGRFEDGGRTFVLTDPSPPRPCDNFLWNDVFFAYVDHRGSGYSRYQTREGAVTECLSGAHYDVVPNRVVYVRDAETGEFWCLGWHPVGAPLEGWECRHEAGCTTISGERGGVFGTVSYLVPVGSDPLEAWLLRLENRSERERRVSLFPYADISLKGATFYGYLQFAGARYLPELPGILAHFHGENLPHPRYNAFFAASWEPSAYECCKELFVGSWGCLCRPRAVAQGRCSSTPASRDALCGVLQADLVLSPGEVWEGTVLVGVCEGVEEAMRLVRRYSGPDRFAEEQAGVREWKKRVFSAFTLRTPDPELDLRLDWWTKQQVHFGAKWVRWGIKGYRDIVQQAHGALYFDPALAREDLLEALAHQREDGTALRGWSPLDRMRYADSPLWLVPAVADFIRETGETSLLEEVVPYFVEEGGRKREGTVYEHLWRAATHLVDRTGAHGLCIVDFGDWNDSLTGVCREGRGESVWLTECVCWALRQMEALALATDRSEDARHARACWERLAAALLGEAFDEEAGYFVRAFDDEGRRIGAPECEEGRIYLNPQSWAVLAGLAELAPEKVGRALDTAMRRLRTPYGYLLLAPAYTRYDYHVGRITGMEPGSAENASVYCHANAFLMAALLALGRGQEAWEVFSLVCPANPELEQSVSGCPPYVFPNAYYGPSHRRWPKKTEYSWVTGSASWFLRLAITEMLGLRPEFDGVAVRPVLPDSWERAGLERVWRGRRLALRVERTGERSLRVDGEKVDGDRVPEALLRDGSVLEATV